MRELRAVVEIGAWILAAACIALLAAQGFIAAMVPSDPQEVPPGPDPQLRLMGEIHLAVESLTPQRDPRIAETLAELDEDYAAPAQRIQLAVLVAEFQGREEARNVLATLGEDATATALADREALERIWAGAALDDATRARLLERHGWFARLAFTQDPDDDDPGRAELVARGRIKLLLGGALGLLLLAVLAAAPVCAIVALVLWRRGALVRRYEPPRPPQPGDALGFALYLLAFIAFSILAQLLAPGAVGVQWLFLPLLAVLLLGVYLAAGVPPRLVPRRLGWHRGRGVLQEMGAGIFGYLAGLPFVAIGLLATILLGILSGAEANHPIEDLGLDAEGVADWLLLLSLAALWAPLIEETMFRGALHHALRARLAVLAMLPLAGLIFAVIHPQGWIAWPVLACLGIVFHVLREWRDSIVAPLTAHACHNGTLVFGMYLYFG